MLVVQPNTLVKEAPSGCEINTEVAYIAAYYEHLAELYSKMTSANIYAKVDAVGLSSRSAENELRYLPFVFGKVIRKLMFLFVLGYWQTENTIYK
jgi:hypothetical protein